MGGSSVLTALLCVGLLLCPGMGHAAPSCCGDVAAAAEAAAKARNDNAWDALDRNIPAPEEGRDGVIGCLDVLGGLADAFSMGVVIPGLEEIIGTMCAEANSYINQKIRKGMREVEHRIQKEFGSSAPFQVNANPGDLAGSLTGRLR